MRLARLYPILITAILCACDDSSSPENAPVSSGMRSKVQDLPSVDEDNDRLRIIEGDPRAVKEEELPVLPPIILLDFANDLENSSLPGDEKSKRTVDGSLGYGFGRNNFFTGKYNYYFPAGKSGTSVSIEESVTPFLPKTIIETIKPITEKPEGDRGIGYSASSLKSAYQSSDSRIDSQSVRASPTRFLGTQPVYGQRTKLYKPLPIDYGYQTFGTSPRPSLDTTQRPDHRQNAPVAGQHSYATPAPTYPSNSDPGGFFDNSQTSSRPYKTHSTQSSASYVTPTASAYRNVFSLNSGANVHQPTPGPSFDRAPTTQRPPSNSPTESTLGAFADLPRYTVENGVRYENKIVWKYPDGKVSQSPPISYVNAYNEFLTKRRPSYDDRSEAYQPGASSQAGNSGQSFQNPYQSSLIGYTNRENRYRTESNIYSKSPAQFPNDEPSGASRPSQFVSSAQLSDHTGLGQQPNPYDSSFQSHYGQKTRPTSGYTASDEPKDLKDSYGSTTHVDHRPISKYAINSPDPEYTYTTDSPVRSTSPASSNLFTPSGEISPKVLSKYTTQAQKYLSKVFATETAGAAAPSSSKNEDPSADHRSLFGYNPSLTQYIRDPSSILKAQPTFIQAGNSLIPVIILRVDGVAPIQPKITPNINLKALLQQYLTQYAGSVAQNANYETANYGKPSGPTSGHSTAQNPLYELTQLAQSLSHYSRNPTFANHFAQRYEDDRKSYDDSYAQTTGYRLDGSKAGEIENHPRKANRQKVKSVQIIDDPRYTSYKVDS